MSAITSFLRPDFTWPRPMGSSICKSTPKVPSSPGKLRLRAWGIVHEALYYISEWYCACFGIQFDANIIQLPFGLVLKWTDRTSLEEAAAMHMARAAGMPIPKVLCCGEHPNAPYNRNFSILMTRLPGSPLENSADTLLVESEDPWLFELRECVIAMRRWTSPHSAEICSAIGTSIRSPRVPGHIMGPFADENEFNDYLLSTASGHGFDTTAEYIKALEQANEIRNYPHRITFTHGDLKAHNILVGDDGHLSGFLDWESAGWYPEYWDFTTAMRYGTNSWWFQVASWIGGDQYRRELKCDIALNSLTVDSYIAF
ncbi:hypothetical protein N7539_001445 [Penicillium diatomitis]|uniref:Aminoglycoside phosphotransferase domain-containing protein n=1 Tax=Penicillium diatomitis TaxID=2819901 RepID=A0A9X0C076_9EURO|nr:uncharacterized protein N7539_001445 [Penicillium diatomitis]KAJ5492699.1 hypothetical protein N7539_001445 [Penicillium diatomitis]